MKTLVMSQMLEQSQLPMDQTVATDYKIYHMLGQMMTANIRHQRDHNLTEETVLTLNGRPGWPAINQLSYLLRRAQISTMGQLLVKTVQVMCLYYHNHRVTTTSHLWTSLRGVFLLPRKA